MVGPARRSVSLRTRLVALAIVAGVPALLLLAGHALADRETAAADDRARAERVLERATDAQTRMLAQGEQLLRLLALHPDVADGDAARCRETLARHLADLPAYHNLARTRPDGTVACSALPLEGPVTVRDLPAFRRLLAAPRFAMSDFMPSPADGRPVLLLALPVRDSSGGVRHILSASLRLDWLDSLAWRSGLPAGASLHVFDERGHLVPVGAEGRAGPDTVPTIVREAGARAVQGIVTLEAATPLGPRDHWTVRRIGRAGDGALLAAVRTPLEVATARTRHELLRDGAAVIACLLVLVAIAWTATTRLVTQPLLAVGRVAQRLAAGDFSARVPVPGASPEVDAFVFAFNQMADALEERDRLFTALAERSPDGIARLAMDGTVLYANPALGQLLGVPAGTLVGRPSDEVLPDALAAAFGTMAALAADAAPASGAVARDVSLGQDGGARTLEVRLVAERDESGSPTAVLAVVRDVSDARQTAEALRQAQKLDSIGQLAGGIAHDFNNLLTGIVGHADLALDELAPDHVAREDVQALRDAALRSTGMTRQLLMFARKQVTTLAPADLSRVVRDVQGLLTRLLGPAVRLDPDLASTLPPVDLDQSQIEQVLVNLAVNARDAMPHGGTLQLRTRLAPVDAAKAARLGVPGPGSYVALEVEDTGTGMPPHVLARIFEPFFTTKAPDKGTGLGLSTCYGIARDHGGALAVTSHVGHGTRFTLYLPASSKAAVDPERTPDAWRDGIAGGHEALLLVEDDAELRALLSRVLRSRGYAVTEVADGAEALRLATVPGAPAIDLVVSDVRTPR
nr:ATP-binding protein [Gemmatimonadaceae bacterium]